MRGTYVCGIVEAYCMDVTARITSDDSVAKTRMPVQCRHGCFDLKATKLLAGPVTPEDDDKTVVCPTCKQGSIVRKCECIHGISVLDESLL